MNIIFCYKDNENHHKQFKNIKIYFNLNILETVYPTNTAQVPQMYIIVGLGSAFFVIVVTACIIIIIW